MAEITIKGIDKLIAKLGRIEATDILRQSMQRSVFRLQAAMAKYPTQRAGSNYRRTGTLGRRWTTKVAQNGDKLIGTVGNSTSYGPFVQSAMFQAAVHQGRWQTDEQVVEKERPAIVDDFKRTIDKELAK